MKIAHSKYRNTGILFEILIRQVTSDTLSGKDSPALPIIKKYFTKTELSKEYRLYETLFKNKNLSELKAEMLINTLLEASTKLNKTSLRKQKYNLIKELKEHYNLDELFKTKLPNYKYQAAFFILIENKNSKETTDTEQIFNNKITLLESLTSSKINKEILKPTVLDEFNDYDKDTRILTYKILLEKFNNKYKNLSDKQKNILKEYINSIDSTPKLKEFYNQNISELKTEIIKLNEKINDKSVKIKITEVVKLLKEIDKTSTIKSDDIVNLLQYYDLIDEIKKTTK
jgi:hypothetical protein